MTSDWLLADTTFTPPSRSTVRKYLFGQTYILVLEDAKVHASAALGMPHADGGARRPAMVRTWITPADDSE